MKVFVTGAAGQLGHDVMEELVSRGHQAVGSDLDAAAVKVVNEKGTELPSTGGFGTTIFYVVGTILVLGAGILLVTRRRMNAI